MPSLKLDTSSVVAERWLSFRGNQERILSVSPELRSWMRPDDLVLYQLDLLPWPAYTLLVERFYEADRFRAWTV